MGVSHRGDAPPAPAAFTPSQTTLSSHATLIFGLSRYNEPCGAVNPLHGGLSSSHSSTLHTESHLSALDFLSHFALQPPSRLYAHSSRAMITFDVDRDIINPWSTHFVSDSASVQCSTLLGVTMGYPTDEPMDYPSDYNTPWRLPWCIPWEICNHGVSHRISHGTCATPCPLPWDYPWEHPSVDP